MSTASEGFNDEAVGITLETIAKIWRDHTDCTWMVLNTEVGPVWSCGIIHKQTTRDRHMAALVMTQVEADRAAAALDAEASR